MKLVAALVLALALLLPGAAVPADTLSVPTGEPVDGIKCQAMEGAVFHIHVHLTLLRDGKPVAIPDDVGRSIVGRCLYWIHTHTPDGIIHIESPLYRDFTLGDFFDIWGETFNPRNFMGKPYAAGQIVIWVNGARSTGDPRAIPLVQHTDIVIQAGPPHPKPAPFADWKGL